MNHSLHFKDPETGQHTNTIEGLWRHAKHSMPQYHRKKKFFFGYLSKYVFMKYCKSHNLDSLVEFYKLAGALYNPCNVIMPRIDNAIRSDESDYEIEIE